METLKTYIFEAANSFLDNDTIDELDDYVI